MSERIKHIFGNSTAYSVEELVCIFRQLSDNITTLHEYSTDDFKVLSSRIREYYEQATVIFQTVSQLASIISNQERNLSAHAEESLKDISTIVTKLQFHDIIRQKLEHIQQINQNIINELLALPQGATNQQGSQANKYLPLMPDITRLHAAQLSHTNAEYQKAFAEIKNNLESIRNKTDIISENCSTFFKLLQHNTYPIQTTPEQIIKLADKLSVEISNSLGSIKHCEAFEKLVDEINSKLSTIFPDNFIEKTGKPSAEKKAILKQLEGLYTMETERIVHKQIFTEKGTASKENKNETGDNLELF
jgi:hypothetical protein